LVAAICGDLLWENADVLALACALSSAHAHPDGPENSPAAWRTCEYVPVIVAVIVPAVVLTAVPYQISLTPDADAGLLRAARVHVIPRPDTTIVAVELVSDTHTTTKSPTALGVNANVADVPCCV
jgi:hypothetical protein